MQRIINRNNFFEEECEFIDSIYLDAIEKLEQNNNELSVTGAFYVTQTTKFPKTSHRYHNNYLIFRIEDSFGGCCLEKNGICSDEVELMSGESVLSLLNHDNLVVRVACLDALLGYLNKIELNPLADKLALPEGSPLKRAIARDEVIASTLTQVKPKDKVLLIGVVNPIVDEIIKLGATCLPCDFNMKETSGGIEVSEDMMPLLQEADHIICTGMTISNGSFKLIYEIANKRKIPLTVFSQTGSNIFSHIAGDTLNYVVAERFPFSQFTSEKSTFFLIRGK